MNNAASTVQNQSEMESARLSRLQEDRFADESAKTDDEETHASRPNARSGAAGLAFMVVVGAAVDVLQAALDFFLIGPFVNWAVSLAAGGIFALWIASRKKQSGGEDGIWGWFFGTFAVEFIPGFDLLPAWTVFTLRYALKEKAKQT